MLEVAAPPATIPIAQGIQNSRFYSEVEALAARFLKRFFAGKTGADGRALPERMVLAPEHVAFVASHADKSDLIECVDRFYEIVLPLPERREVRYLVSLLNDGRALRIPKNFVGPIACVHARVVGRWVPPGVAIAEEPVFEDDSLEDDSLEDVDSPDDFELGLVGPGEDEDEDPEPILVPFFASWD